LKKYLRLWEIYMRHRVDLLRLCKQSPPPLPHLVIGYQYISINMAGHPDSVPSYIKDGMKTKMYQMI